MESNKVIKLAKKLSKRANIKFQKTYDYFKALPPSEWTNLPKEFVSKS